MSPDLNPLENIWSIIKEEVYKNATDAMWDAITSAWHSLPIEAFKNLYESIPQCLIKVKEEKGERISYSQIIIYHELSFFCKDLATQKSSTRRKRKKSQLNLAKFWPKTNFA